MVKQDNISESMLGIVAMPSAVKDLHEMRLNAFASEIITMHTFLKEASSYCMLTNHFAANDIACRNNYLQALFATIPHDYPHPILLHVFLVTLW